MLILKEKADTKRPPIVAAATSLFSTKGIDATSMRDIADAAGVREAAIYRHFRGKEEMAAGDLLSWYGGTVNRSARSPRRSLAPDQNPFAGPSRIQSCARTSAGVSLLLSRTKVEVSARPCRRYSAGPAGTDQNDPRGIATTAICVQGTPELLADMLSGALCAVAISATRRKASQRLLENEEISTEGCWQMLRHNAEEVFMTSEEQLIKRYFDAFNRHDLEAVLACFHDEAVLVGPNGKRLVGHRGSSTFIRNGIRAFPMRIASFGSARQQWPRSSRVVLFGNTRWTRKDRGDWCGSHRDRGRQDQRDPRLPSAGASQGGLKSCKHMRR